MSLAANYSFQLALATYDALKVVRFRGPMELGHLIDDAIKSDFERINLIGTSALVDASLCVPSGGSAAHGLFLNLLPSTIAAEHNCLALDLSRYWPQQHEEGKSELWDITPLFYQGGERPRLETYRLIVPAGEKGVKETAQALEALKKAMGDNLVDVFFAPAPASPPPSWHDAAAEIAQWLAQHALGEAPALSELARSAVHEEALNTHVTMGNPNPKPRL